MRGHACKDHATAGEDIRQMSGAAHVKRVHALHQRKLREAEGRFLVQGRKAVAELLASPLEVLELYATETCAAQMALTRAMVVPEHQLDRMGTLQQGNEVLAVVRMPASPKPRFPQGDRFVLALDGVADPGNLGTLLRIADWFGALQVWCAGGVDPYNPKAVQASMGSLFRMPPCAVPDLAGLLAQATHAGAHVYRAEASGQDVFMAQMTKPAVLVLGSESHGLSEAVKKVPGLSVAVPGRGGAESLNVAAAAAALCMELIRPGPAHPA